MNPGFDGEFLALDGLCCFMFTGETDQPEKVRDMLLAEIERLRTEGVDEELFTLCKNQLYGEMVQDLESTESAASLLAGSFLRGCRPGEELEALASVTKQDLDDALQTMLRPSEAPPWWWTPPEGRKGETAYDDESGPVPPSGAGA